MELREVNKPDYNLIKAKKRRRRKKRAAVFAVFFVLILIIAAAVACFTVLFPINTVSVSGNNTYSTEEILAVCGIDKGDKLFSVFENKTEKVITTCLPYVKTVKLKKVLPDKLEIKVTETTAQFAFFANDVYYLADEDFKVLEKTESVPENVTRITLPQAIEPEIAKTIDKNTREIALVSKTYELLKQYDISVNSITISGYDLIKAVINGRFSVNFGNENELSGKIAHLSGMLGEIDKKNGQDCTGKIDLTAWSNTKREGYFEITGNFEN